MRKNISAYKNTYTVRINCSLDKCETQYSPVLMDDIILDNNHNLTDINNY